MKYNPKTATALSSFSLPFLHPDGGNGWFFSERDPCYGNNVFMTSSKLKNSFMYSQGGWKASSLRYFVLSPRLVASEIKSVKQVVATPKSLVILTDSGLFSITNLQSVSLSTGVEFPISDVKVPPFCTKGEETSKFAQAVVAWNRQDGVSSFYLSKDEGRSFIPVQITLADDGPTPNKIQDITFQAMYSVLVLLVRNSRKQDETIFYNTQTKIFSRGFEFNITELSNVLDGGKKVSVFMLAIFIA
jgi:hypothetical protein